MADSTGSKYQIAGSLEAQLRECFGRVAYSHKTHEKSADLLQARLHCLKAAQIILSAITTTGLLTAIFTGPETARCAAAVTAIFSTALFALTTYTKDFDLGSKSQSHKDAADRLWVIREAFLSLLTDARSGGMDDASARERRDRLQDDLSVAYRSAPRTFPKAYAEAQKALRVSEDLTFSDKEIDALLPAALRKAGRE